MVDDTKFESLQLRFLVYCDLSIKTTSLLRPSLACSLVGWDRDISLYVTLLQQLPTSNGRFAHYGLYKECHYLPTLRKYLLWPSFTVSLVPVCQIMTWLITMQSSPAGPLYL